jgi:hypothetical protein
VTDGGAHLGLSVYFKVDLGDGDPDSLTRATGVLPTETQRAGDPLSPPLPLGRTRVRSSAWIVRSAATDPIFLEPHVESILEHLRPGWDALVNACRWHRVSLNCVLNCMPDQTTPAVHLNPSAVRALAELGAEVDIDLYVRDWQVDGPPPIGRRSIGGD